MERWRGRVAVVTGASAGIGAAIVEDLVEHGVVVVGLARREGRLLEMKKRLHGKNGALHTLKTDVTKENEVKQAFDWIRNTLGGVDILVNNAGVLIKAMTTDGNANDWRKMFDVNVFALGYCIREALNSMKERKVDDGHIININSIAGHRVNDYPGQGPYCSSKHASKALTESLRRELVVQKSKIKVTSISPGVVDTEIFDSAPIATEMSKIPHLQAKDIADAVHYVLATTPNVQVNELIIRPVGSGM